MTFGEIFIIGIVVIVLCVMAEEFLEAYDEYMGGDDDELQYGIFNKIYHAKWSVTYLMLQI